MVDYVVVAPAVVVPTDGPQGRALSYFYTNSPLPSGVPAETVKHLLRRKQIRAVGGDAELAESKPTEAESEPVEAEQDSPPQGHDSSGSGPNGVEAAEDAARAEARAKLPADGSLPDGRAGHPVWVEAAVARGYDYKVASKATKKELQELLSK